MDTGLVVGVDSIVPTIIGRMDKVIEKAESRLAMYDALADLPANAEST